MLPEAEVSHKDDLDRASIISVIGKTRALMRLDQQNIEVGYWL
jgi:hypothetical protein